MLHNWLLVPQAKQNPPWNTWNLYLKQEEHYEGKLNFYSWSQYDTWGFF